ncbi:MAG TPA: hypothetical protein QGF58_05175 [Myxococcota bacterium]|nr:hypothetical protein [Myxococcota bacterium]
MYNLLIALGVGVLAFGLGTLGGKWLYGFAPAMLVAPAVYFFLARRSGKQLEAIMAKAMNELQDGRVKVAKETIASGYPLGKWQFLISKQIHAQLGALEYIQKNYKQARPLLEKAWSRNWQAQGMLAVIDARDKKHDEAIARFEKATFLGKKEPVMWALWVWLLLDAKRVEAAMKKAAEAVETCESNKTLKELQAAIANDKMKRFKWGKVFGQSWYQFFPDQVPVQRGASPANHPNMRGRKTYPHPRR